MDINYLDNIISKLSQYTDQDLIDCPYWDIIYNNLYLTNELLKLNTFTLFDKINPIFFKEEMICLSLLNNDNTPYDYIDSHVLESTSFWVNALTINYTLLSKIPESFLEKNPQFNFWVCEKFSQYPMLEFFPDTLKNNFDLCYFAVHNNPMNFKFISTHLKNSPYIYEVIYKQKSTTYKSSDFFKIAGPEIRSQYKFAKKSIIENPSSFEFIADNLKNDPSFFFDMLNYCDIILQYAPPNIKKNEYCVLASIEKNPLSLEFADKKFLSSVDFILSIHDHISQYHNFSDFAKMIDTKIFCDTRFIEKYFQQISDHCCYHLLGDNICNDPYFMSRFCSLNINCFKFASEKLKKDIVFITDCYEVHNQHNLLEQFNIDSTQSSLFYMLEENSLNDILFIENLFKHFKPIFKDVIFPIIQKKKTILTELLSNELDIEVGITHLLHKFELKNKLENQLNNKTIINKPLKI